MEQKAIEVPSGALVPRVNLDQLVNLGLLAPAFQGWLAYRGQSGFQVKLDQMDPRVLGVHLELQDSLDLLGSQVLRGSLLVERKAVRNSSVLLTVQQDPKAPRDCRVSRDTKDVLVYSETPAALEERVPREM